MRTVKSSSIAITEIICDFCKSQGFHSCWLCEKDCCYDCSDIWPEDGFDDYPRRICFKCKIIAKPYIADLELLKTNYEISVEETLTRLRECVKV